VFEIARNAILYSLPTSPTEAPLNALPASSCVVSIPLHDTPRIIYHDLFFLNDQVGRYKGAGNLAAIGAMAQMATLSGEQFIVVDGNANTTAKTRRAHAFAELGNIVAVRIACQFCGVDRHRPCDEDIRLERFG
jgi:hypothetical protein